MQDTSAMRTAIRLLASTLCLLIFSVACATPCLAQIKLRLGHAPNFWFTQQAIIKGEGWDREAGFELELIRFAGPADVLQAFVAGETDGMTNNLAAVMLAAQAGVPIKIVSATFKGDITLLARGKLQELRRNLTAIEALEHFVQITGRRVKIATNPKGSLSDLMFRYWIKEKLKDPLRLLEVIHAGDQAQLQQLFLSGAVDGMSAFAPLVTLMLELEKESAIFVAPADIMPFQPGGCLVLRNTFISSYPKITSDLITLYERANQFILENPEVAARHIQTYVTGRLLSDELVRRSLRESRDFFTTDIRPMIDPTHILINFMVKERYLKKAPDLDAMLYRHRPL